MYVCVRLRVYIRIAATKTERGLMSRVILDKKAMDIILNRMAYEIIEDNKDLTELCVVGIRTNGVPLAERLAEKISRLGVTVLTGILDITLYRDDLLISSKIPEVRTTEFDFDVNGKNIVLVDDVLFTGRTVHAAINAIMEYGRPDSVKAAVLIDRGHRELPVCADYVGKTVETLCSQSVDVLLFETNGEDLVRIRN